MVDVAKLQGAVDDLIRAARDIAPETLRSYERRWRMWRDFAHHYGIVALPAEAEHVEAFVVARHDAGVSPSGIGANLSAIAWFHSRFGEQTPVTDGARTVLGALSKVQPGPPARPAPVLSVGALLAMVQRPPAEGTDFATKLVRGALPEVKPRQLLTVEASDVTWGRGDAWADVRLRPTEPAGSHPAIPARTVRLVADPGWAACPVRGLRVLEAAAGADGPLFTKRSVFKASTGSFNASDATEGVYARLGVRDSTIVCVGYGGALRNEELSRARVEHLEPLREGFLLHLPAAKTIRSMPDQSVLLQRRDDALDPVAAINRWLAVRGDHDGPLFVHLHHRAPGRLADGDGPPSGSIKDIVGDLAVRAGLSKSVSGYSLRRSWATHQYLSDPDSIGMISLQLRHADINMTVRYIEDLRLGLIEPAAFLSADAVAAGPGGVGERCKDIGFNEAPLDELVTRARKLLPPAASHAPGTRRSRQAHWSVWEKFAQRHAISALPATPEGLALFVAKRADDGRKPHYLGQQLRTIQRRHQEAGMVGPGLIELAEEVLDAYARSAEVGTRKAPILAGGDLAAMAQHALDKATPCSLRDLVVVAVATPERCASTTCGVAAWRTSSQRLGARSFVSALRRTTEMAERRRQPSFFDEATSWTQSPPSSGSVRSRD